MKTIEMIVSVLEQQPTALFAILDAARERKIKRRLRDSGQVFQSLYEGAPDLEDHGPFLVELRRGTPTLRELIRDGWGKSWGVYLCSGTPFVHLRRHLRRFLMVKLPDGREAYFRFYDPRVLRVFLSRSTFSEARSFIGPAHGYWMEGDSPHELMYFSAGTSAISIRSISVNN